MMAKTSNWVGYRIFSLLVYPFLKKRFQIRREAPWVIGGHRGRIYEDNSASLHQYILRQTQQPIIWITSNPEVYDQLKSQRATVLYRHSVQARSAILQAPVLIYSHGEDDLDEYLLYEKKISGFRVYLNHCLNIIKAGQCYSDYFEKLNPLQKQKFQNSITQFDRFLVSSELEQKFARLSFPHLADKIVLGGGAHLDYFFDPINRTGIQKKILYFPTFRDSGIKTKDSVQEVIRQLVNHSELIDWLHQENKVFEIGCHINTGPITIPEEAKNIFRVIGPTQLKKSLMECEIFISDYSGIQGDYLVLQKPIIHFVYDLADYLKVRRLYSKYEEFAFGPIVRSVTDLIATLKTKQYLKDEYATMAKERFSEYFSINKPEYAKTSFNTIMRELNNRQTTLH
jgi:hypothetical protein